MATLASSPIPGTPPPASVYAPLMKTALVAGVFCLAICGLLLVFHFRAKAQDPLNSPQLTALKAQLLAEPKNEPLKEQIRALDLQLRSRYFRQLVLKETGAWLALVSLGAFLIAGQKALQSRRQLPMPQPRGETGDQAARTAAWSRGAVAGVALLTAIAVLPLAFLANTGLPGDVAGVEKLLGTPASTEGAPAHYASAAEMQQNWPQFRGPGGDGLVTAPNLPIRWDGRTEAPIAWKSAISATGFNSPIVWGERLFMSGGDASKREVFCYGTRTGELLWVRPVQNVPGSPSESPDIPEHTGYAPSTMATDGRRVYAIFANGDLAAFSLDGQQVWAKNLGVPKNPHGHATSLITWQGRLLVQWDHGEAEENLSKLYAFDGLTGRVVWQKTRPVSVSWATPMVMEAAGKPQIITLAVPWVIAYHAQTGAELWRVEGLHGEVTPSPAVAGGLALATTPYDNVMAIRPDGQGDVTSTHVVWKAEDHVPDISSPVGNNELLFMLTTPGMLTCFDAKDGAKQWEEDLGIEFHASPTLAGDRLYLVATKGILLVVEAGRTYQELGRTDLGETIHASPAFAQGKIFLRGTKHLFCIGQSDTLAQIH